MLFSAGAQVPVMPLFEVVGNADKVAPEQIEATAVNVGVMLGLTTFYCCIHRVTDHFKMG